MFRYLVAQLPTFRLDRCGWLSHQPVVLLAEERNALRVQSATPAARKGGVRPGMSATEARALLPALQVELLDPLAEVRDLDDLAQQLLRVSPKVTTMAPDSLVAEISRVLPARAGAERALLERVRIRLEQLGHRAHVVVADDPSTAWACAAWGQRCQVIPHDQGAAAMAALPLAALELPPKDADLLIGLGLRTVGAFAALPPHSVVGRLGPLAIAAHALARGDAPRPSIAPWQDDQPLLLTQPLLHPVDQREALLFVLNALLRDAAAHLAAANRAAVRLVLRLTLDPQQADPVGNGDTDPGPPLASCPPGGVQELSLRLGAPTRDPRRMLELLRVRLDRLVLAGPVVAVSIEVPDPDRFTGRQQDLLDRQRASEALDGVVARLQDELGLDAVIVPQIAPRHRPEAAWRATRLRATPTQTAPAYAVGCHADILARKRPEGSDPVRAWEGFPTLPPLRRPALLHQPALSVDVHQQAAGAELGDLPRQIHIDGRWQALVDLSGPEALAGDWWRYDFDRMYWCGTLADGRRAWLYLEAGHWLLHGWFD